jgi:hypothetical protein
MDGQRARLVSTLDRIPTIGKAPAPGVPALLKPVWAWVLGLGWPLMIVVAPALEPAPADPDAAVPAIVTLGTIGLITAVMATAVAASQRHTSAAIGGVVTGLIALAFTISCPLSGHHTFGAWWFGQLALTLPLLGASLAALSGRAREPA